MFKESMKENIELEGPSGITWHVKMMRSNNTLRLRSGWKDFVTANKIDQNDILVFTYNGSSSFKVIIFDRSGCEKVAPFFAKNMKTETSEKSNDSPIRENMAPHHEVKKEIIYLFSGNSDTDEYSCEISNRAARARTTGEKICGKRKQRDFVQEASESVSDEGEHGTVRKRKAKENHKVKKASHLYVIPFNTYLTKAQEEIANRMARKAQKGSDLLVKILTQTDTYTNRYCKLVLPSGFACKVLHRKKKKIILVPANLDKRNNTCTANYCFKNKKMVRYIGKGWRQFVRENELKQGDLCLFELRKQDKRGILTMVVHFNHK
ncbi:B3 domain-containing protein LOC_Os12g40090-like [Carex rostrata]